MSSKDDSTLGLFTPDKTLEPNSLKPPLSLNTSVKKKPYYVIILADKTELKKNIIGDIKEWNIVKGKRVKKRLKAYAGFLTNVIKDKSLPA